MVTSCTAQRFRSREEKVVRRFDRRTQAARLAGPPRQSDRQGTMSATRDPRTSEERRALALYKRRDDERDWRVRMVQRRPHGQVRAGEPTAGLDRRHCRTWSLASANQDYGGCWNQRVGGGGLLPWLRDELGVPAASMAGIRPLRDQDRLGTLIVPRGPTCASARRQASPWPTGSFDVVVASTLFSSVLDPGLRDAIAEECLRVLRPKGVVLWYDMRDDFLFAHAARRLAKPEEDWLGLREISRLFRNCDIGAPAIDPVPASCSTSGSHEPGARPRRGTQAAVSPEPLPRHHNQGRGF